MFRAVNITKKTSKCFGRWGRRSEEKGLCGGIAGQERRRRSRGGGVTVVGVVWLARLYQARGFYFWLNPTKIRQFNLASTSTRLRRRFRD